MDIALLGDVIDKPGYLVAVRLDDHTVFGASGLITPTTVP
jgi:hypothetical protein